MTTKTSRLECEYENAQITAQDLVVRISNLLTDFPAPGSDSQIDWSQVGTVNEVNRQLENIVEFLLSCPKK